MRQRVLKDIADNISSVHEKVGGLHRHLFLLLPRIKADVLYLQEGLLVKVSLDLVQLLLADFGALFAISAGWVLSYFVQRFWSVYFSRRHFDFLWLGILGIRVLILENGFKETLAVFVPVKLGYKWRRHRSVPVSVYLIQTHLNAIDLVVVSVRKLARRFYSRVGITHAVLSVIGSVVHGERLVFLLSWVLNQGLCTAKYRMNIIVRCTWSGKLFFPLIWKNYTKSS